MLLEFLRENRNRCFLIAYDSPRAPDCLGGGKGWIPRGIEEQVLAVQLHQKAGVPKNP